MYFLDANTVIYLFRGEGRVMDRMFATSVEEVAIPAPVLYELEVGIANSSQPARRRTQIDTLLTAVAVVPFDRAAAVHASQAGTVLRRAGSMIGPIDILIAGTALAHGATVVTRNAREFRRVRGLAVEDWY